MTSLTCFKAYDIRGRLGTDLDENIVYRVGAAFALAPDAKTVVLGRDVRSFLLGSTRKKRRARAD